jgi:hypothetical protein
MSTVVPDTNINFPQEEEKIVQLWAELGKPHVRFTIHQLWLK